MRKYVETIKLVALAGLNLANLKLRSKTIDVIIILLCTAILYRSARKFFKRRE
ncbi:MAG: hypothetical protein Q4A78_10010 [Peptostreptococcaceae bacterium]|nr:hypothetical protein [Peptostreptococcaceae bacterium]